MEIKVVRKEKPVEQPKVVNLVFKKHNIKSQYKRTPTVCIFDDKGEYLQASVKLTSVPKKVPSTLLSRWINANFADKLLTLVDRCHTVERIKDDVGGKYYFTHKENALFGLHKIKLKCGDKTHRLVSIDDGLGMMYVLKILNEIGVDIESNYDKVSNKMIGIKLLLK